MPRHDRDSYEGKSLLVSEEALQTEVGHFFEYNRSIYEIAKNFGVETAFAIHKQANQSIIDVLSACPVYEKTSWGSISTERNPVKRHAGTIIHNLRVYSTMREVLKQLGGTDVIFAPTVTIHHLLGFYLLARRHLGRDFKRLVILTRNNIASYDEGSSIPNFKRQSIIFAKLIQSLSKIYSSEEFAFTTDSERLADEYEVLCGIRPIVMPSPRIAPPRIAPLRLAEAKSDGLTRFVSLGPARFEKGIDLFETAIAQTLNAPTPLRSAQFIVQWNQPVYDGPKLVTPNEELLVHPATRYITEDMSSDVYDSELYNADCIVLPYRRSSYFARISGVAVEAVTAGIPLIYTKDTWCEGLVQISGAGIGIPDGDAKALADAIREITENIDHYRQAAKDAAKQARDANSPDSFMRLLFGLTKASKTE